MKSRSAGKSNHRKPEKARVTRTRGHEQDTTIVAHWRFRGWRRSSHRSDESPRPDTGMALSWCNILDPKHHSILTELLPQDGDECNGRVGWPGCRTQSRLRHPAKRDDVHF